MTPSNDAPDTPLVGSPFTSPVYQSADWCGPTAEYMEQMLVRLAGVHNRLIEKNQQVVTYYGDRLNETEAAINVLLDKLVNPLIERLIASETRYSELVCKCTDSYIRRLTPCYQAVLEAEEKYGTVLEIVNVEDQTTQIAPPECEEDKDRFNRSTALATGSMYPKDCTMPTIPTVSCEQGWIWWRWGWRVAGGYDDPPIHWWWYWWVWWWYYWWWTYWYWWGWWASWWVAGWWAWRYGYWVSWNEHSARELRESILGHLPADIGLDIESRDIILKWCDEFDRCPTRSLNEPKQVTEIIVDKSKPVVMGERPCCPTSLQIEIDPDYRTKRQAFIETVLGPLRDSTPDSPIGQSIRDRIASAYIDVEPELPITEAEALAEYGAEDTSVSEEEPE